MCVACVCARACRERDVYLDMLFVVSETSQAEAWVSAAFFLHDLNPLYLSRLEVRQKAKHERGWSRSDDLRLVGEYQSQTMETKNSNKNRNIMCHFKEPTSHSLFTTKVLRNWQQTQQSKPVMQIKFSSQQIRHNSVSIACNIKTNASCNERY